VVTAEEHSIIGGLGGAVAEILSENYPVPLERVGIKDKFGDRDTRKNCGKYGLTSGKIVEAAERVLKMKTL
jgi:transketolase